MPAKSELFMIFWSVYKLLSTNLRSQNEGNSMDTFEAFWLSVALIVLFVACGRG
jgi:hypothetical protein